MKHHLFLKKVPLFSGLSERDLRLLSDITHVREVKKGEAIFSKASWGDTLYVVEKGMVKIFSKSRVGRMKTFAYLEAKDFFGEMALLGEGHHRSAAAVALSPATLLTIRRVDFQKILSHRPALALALLNTLCERLRRADREIESLSFNSVLGRVARILLDLGSKYGKKSSKGIRIDLEISHKELADMVGTAREMVTRVLNRFVRVGCLEMDGKHITLTKPAKMRDWII